MGRLRTRQKRPTEAEMDTRPPGVNRQHRPVFADRKVVVSLAFVDIACGETHPNRSRRHLLKFLHRQVGKVPEQPPRVV